MRRLFWVAFVAVGIAGGAAIIYGLSELAQQNPKEERAPGAIPAGAPIRMVRLYFGAPDRVGLIPEERAISDPGGPVKLAEAIAAEVFHGPQGGTGVTGLSPLTKVRAFYLAPDGTGYLDLSRDFLESWPQGDGLEWVSLGSIVRSLTENVAGLRSVYILVEGRMVDRAPGSIPLDLPLDPEGFGASSPAGAETETETDL